MQKTILHLLNLNHSRRFGRLYFSFMHLPSSSIRQPFVWPSLMKCLTYLPCLFVKQTAIPPWHGWCVREVFTLPLSVISAHRQAHIQLPPAIRRTRQNHWFVRIMGGLFSLFLLSTFRVLPCYPRTICTSSLFPL